MKVRILRIADDFELNIRYTDGIAEDESMTDEYENMGEPMYKCQSIRWVDWRYMGGRTFTSNLTSPARNTPEQKSGCVTVLPYPVSPKTGKRDLSYDDV